MGNILEFAEWIGKALINYGLANRERVTNKLAQMDSKEFKKYWDNIDKLDPSKADIIKNAAKKRGWRG